METTGIDATWLNGKNEIHNRSINNIVREGLIESNQQETNGSMQQRHHQKSIDTISTVN